jgi:hypothetical protein
MFRFFRDLCGYNDQARYDSASKNSALIFRQAAGSGAFSSESNVILSLGAYLIGRIDAASNKLIEIEEKIKQHDLIVSGIVSVVSVMNFNKYNDPYVPFNLAQLEDGLEYELNAIWRAAWDKEKNDEIDQALMEYVTGIGKKILVDKKFPLLEFDSPTGHMREFHRSVDSLLIDRHQDVKRYPGIRLYEYPGQYLDEYYGSMSGRNTRMTREDRLRIRDQKVKAIESAPAPVETRSFRIS